MVDFVSFCEIKLISKAKKFTMEELLARVDYLENIVSKLAKWTHFAEIVSFDYHTEDPVSIDVECERVINPHSSKPQRRGRTSEIPADSSLLVHTFIKTEVDPDQEMQVDDPEFVIFPETECDDPDYFPKSSSSSNSQRDESNLTNDDFDSNFDIDDDTPFTCTKCIPVDPSTNQDDETTPTGEPSKKRRSKIPDPSKWKSVINKTRRMTGEKYYGFKHVKVGSSIKQEHVPMPEKKIGQTCQSGRCAEVKTRHCNEFRENCRQQMFHNFWKHMNWAEKKIYAMELIEIVPCKDQRTEESRREETYIYHLKLGGRKVQVCRTMFLNTLGLGRHQVKGWIKSSLSGAPVTNKRSAKVKNSSEETT